MATERPFVVSASLTALAIGYRNPDKALIAEKVLPPRPVYSERFKWTEYPTKEGFRSVDNRVGRTGEVPRVDFSAFERDSSVVDYGMESPIPISDIQEAEKMREAGQSIVDPRQQAVTGITYYNQLQREKRTAALVHNPASYPAGQQIVLSGTDQFDDPDSDPIGVISTALESTLIFRPNKLVMNKTVISKLTRHPKMINAIKGGLQTEGIVTKEQITSLFEGLDEILVGEALLDGAKWGQPLALQRVWGNHIAAIHVDREASPQNGQVTFGFTAKYGTAIAGEILDAQVGLQGGVVVRAGDRERQLVVAPDVGFLIQNAVSG